MHIVINKKYLIYKNYKVKCALGKRGIGTKRKEGDLITPKGEFKIKYILYRKENIYDIILVLNYNMFPIIKNKGSAIFIHIAKKNYKKTKGCIALKKVQLLKIIRELKKDSKVKIVDQI